MLIEIIKEIRTNQLQKENNSKCVKSTKETDNLNKNNIQQTAI